MGIIERRKNQLMLVRAMAEVLGSVPQAKLLLIGSLIRTEYVARVKALARDSELGG